MWRVKVGLALSTLSLFFVFYRLSRNVFPMTRRIIFLSYLEFIAALCFDFLIPNSLRIRNLTDEMRKDYQIMLAIPFSVVGFHLCVTIIYKIVEDKIFLWLFGCEMKILLLFVVQFSLMEL